MSQGTSDQDRIEHDLQRTRSRMDSRLSELQDRLTPGQILDDLMGYFRGSEGADFARNLMASVRSNPLPAALTGIGLAWLMAANPHSRSDAANGNTAASTTPNAEKVRVPPGPGGVEWASHEDLDFRVRTAEQNVTRQAHDTEEAYRMRLDEARGAVLGVARGAQDTPEPFGRRIQDALATTRQSLTQSTHSLRDRAADAASQLTSAAQHAGDQVVQGGQAARQAGSNLMSTITDNPVLLGAISLGVGALLGALVPQLEKEEAALGAMAGQAREAARNLAQEVVDRGGQLAQQALDAGRDSARAHGLTGDTSIGELVGGMKSGGTTETLKEVAHDVLQATDQAFRKEALGQEQPASARTSAGSNRPATQPS